MRFLHNATFILLIATGSTAFLAGTAHASLSSPPEAADVVGQEAGWTMPPQPVVDLLGSSQIHKGFLGRPDYFVTPARVEVRVLDTAGGRDRAELVIQHNGRRIAPGQVLSEPGLHELFVTERFPDGEVRAGHTVFEIRERPRHQAYAHLVDLAWDEGEGGISQVMAELFLHSQHFDVSTIAPETVNFWLENDEGEWIRATGKGPVYDVYENCARDMVFSADLSRHELAVMPDRIILTGRGVDREGVEYEFLCEQSSSPAGVRWSPPCKDRPRLRSDDDEPVHELSCLWLVDRELEEVDRCTWAEFAPGTNADLASGSSMTLFASGGYLGGNGSCFVNHVFPRSVSASCSVASGFNERHYYEKPEFPCCDSCLSRVSAAPMVKGSTNIDPMANSFVSGTVAVTIAGNSAISSGSVSLNSDGPGNVTVTIGPIQTVTPVPAGILARTFAAIGRPPMTATVRDCEFSVVVQTAATIDLTAHSTWFNWYGAGNGGITAASSGHRVRTGNDCDW